MVRQEQKQRERTKNMYDIPKPVDVLLGRGRPFQDYLGNIRLAQLVEDKRNNYQLADKHEKTGWKEVSDLVAPDKVSQTFCTKFATINTKKLDEASNSYDTNPSKRIWYDLTVDDD